MSKKIELKTPSDWREVTLHQYKHLLKLQTETEVKDQLDLYKLRIGQISILNPDVAEEDIKRMSLEQLTHYFKEIDFLDNEPVKADQSTLTIEGKEYKFTHFKNLTLEQWIDAEKYSSMEDAHKLIAIFYIDPKEYDDVELDKVSEWLDKQPAHIGFWTISQFFFIQKALELSISLYSEKELKKVEKIKRVIEISKRIDHRLKQFGSKFSTILQNMTSKK